MSGQQKVQAGGVDDLRRAAREFRNAERVRDDEISRAHHLGSSLRVISSATGLSTETVRGIVKRQGEFVQTEQALLDILDRSGSAGGTTLEQIRAEKRLERRKRHLAHLTGAKIQP